MLGLHVEYLNVRHCRRDKLELTGVRLHVLLPVRNGFINCHVGLSLQIGLVEPTVDALADYYG